MCTVTFIPKSNSDFILTSNRDEFPFRVSKPPKLYTENKVNLLYPKDESAQGTWIGVSSKNRLICLLNGAFQLHNRKSKYRISRGIMVKELLQLDTIEAVKNYNFKGIEPFTLVIVEWQSGLQLYELIWDENKVYFSALPLAPKLWSSSTLYTDKMKAERQNWFSEFKVKKAYSSEAIVQFHNSHSDNAMYGFVMNRVVVKTTSITQVERHNSNLKMYYNDKRTDEDFTVKWN